MQSLSELSFQRSRSEPERIACRFFKGSGLIQEVLTFSSLYAQAASLAQHLQANGLTNERAVLVCKSQKSFVIAFYACLLAGTVAVPAAPPRREALQSRLQLIARDAMARAIIFDSDEMLQAQLRSDGDDLLKVDVRAVEAAFASRPPVEDWRPVVPSETTPAFLQYTSGSTGDPKGVVVSHGNLLHNCAAIEEAMQITPHSSLFTALPLFHDMGLVGGVLQLMYSGCSASFLSPTEFVQYPERWLKIISEFRVTVSGGPNFMYDLAARAIAPEALEGIELSSWRVAFCGAEPIRPAVIARFTERFAAYGFRAEAFYPCYGMAESTLLITGSKVFSLPSIERYEGAEVVGCGVPWRETSIEIVDPETLQPLPPGDTGEIWVRGPSVALGYWRRPQLSEQVFQAQIAGAGPGYLRTGDLGFLRDGALYVTGRLKDLIIVNGRKYAPQEIEDRCERSHDALRPAGGAAFGLSDGKSERLVVVFELKRGWLRRHHEWPKVLSSIRASINGEYGLPVSDVVLIKPGALPRTSSGKVRRTQCRMDYLSGVLERVTSP